MNTQTLNTATQITIDEALGLLEMHLRNGETDTAKFWFDYITNVFRAH